MRKTVLACLFACIVLTNLAMSPWYDHLFKSQDPDRSAVNVLLDALGDLRTYLAQSIWFKVDLYHHEMEAQNIPWTEERDIMPMYRMVTTLDPRFVDAYDTATYDLVANFSTYSVWASITDGSRIISHLSLGAAGMLVTGSYVRSPYFPKDTRVVSASKMTLSAVLSQRATRSLARAPLTIDNPSAAEEGLAYLRQGIRHNPRSAKLYEDMAFLLQYHLGRSAEAIPYAERALRLTLPHASDVKSLSTGKLVRYLNCLRTACHAAESSHNRPAEIHFLRMWLFLHPHDPYPRNRMKALGLAPTGYTMSQFERAQKYEWGIPPTPSPAASPAADGAASPAASPAADITPTPAGAAARAADGAPSPAGAASPAAPR